MPLNPAEEPDQDLQVCVERKPKVDICCLIDQGFVLKTRHSMYKVSLEMKEIQMGVRTSLCDCSEQLEGMPTHLE